MWLLHPLRLPRRMLSTPLTHTPANIINAHHLPTTQDPLGVILRTGVCREKAQELFNGKIPCAVLPVASTDKPLMLCHLVTKYLSFTEAKTLSHPHKEKAQQRTHIQQDLTVQIPPVISFRLTQTHPIPLLLLWWPSQTWH